MVTVFYVTLLAITTLIWGYVFYKKDYHPQPIKVLAQSFIAGLLAMAPVFGYKYLYQNFLPALAEYEIFRPILDSPLISGLAVFIFNLTVLSLVLFALSGIASLVLNFFSHAIIINLKNAIKEEPLGFTAVSVLLGLCIYLESFAQKIFAFPIIGTAIGSILFLAIIEEYVKHLMVRITDDKKIKDIDDAITLSIIVGLAFAFIETIIYGFLAGSANVILFRSIISLPIHLVASGIFGYYYGLAHFAEPISKINGDKTGGLSKWLPKMLSLKRSTVYKEEKIIEGIFFATLFHSAMNLLFELNMGFLTVPFIIGGVFMLFRMYRLGQAESAMMARLKTKNA